MSLIDTELILGNSNSRFSGVTSTMLQVLKYQRHMMKVAVMGSHHLPENTPTLTFLQTLRLCRTPLPNGRLRVFHARRNDEMLQALALKKIFGAKIRIAFTSTAQRQHSWITRWLEKEADIVITTSSAANHYIQGGADAIIPHGVDLDQYHPAADRYKEWESLGFQGKKGIGIFGRVRHQKGVDIFVDALIPLMEKHPEYTAVICGETTSDQIKFQQSLTQKINTSGLKERFLFLGKQPFSELPKLFRSMSIVTALSRNEGFGLTVLEAMASGTAVLASEAGAWQDIIRQGQDGWITPCGDVESTRQKLALMMQNPKTLESMGKSGRNRVESSYTLEREAKELCKLFSSMQET